MASSVFQEAARLGIKLEMLDIGGGFPGHEAGDISFLDISRQVNASLEEHFPQSAGVRVIAEPGRYFVSAACSLATNVIGKRDKMYYINDGVYGSFNCLLYDHATVEVNTLETSGSETERHESSVWGPTCDGLDCVLPSVSLPELSPGDWLYFNNMGAYTMAAGSTFNGMPRPQVHYVIQELHWQTLQQLAGAEDVEERETDKETGEKSKCCEVIEVTIPILSGHLLRSTLLQDGFTAYNHSKDFLMPMQNVYREIF